MRHLIRTLALLLGCCAGTLALAAPAMAGTPTDAIRATTSEVIRILHDEELSSPARYEERRLLLDQIIGDRLTYEEISRRALGGQWDRLSEGERDEFVQLFRSLLVNMYAGRIEDFGVNQMQFLAERTERGIAEVRARLVSRKSDIILDFRLVNRAGEWLVYDILTDGISLVNSYRQQFQRVLRFTSYSTLVEKLREATARSGAALARN